jgi:glycosyltransferase involved in cell wall biosynthesis
VRAIGSVADDHIHVLLNGVDTVRFSPERSVARRAALRADLGLAPDDVAFLLAAHNLRMKNFALFARVFPHVVEQCPTARLVVMGKQAPPTAAPWLLYAGATQRPEDVYAAMDALVHPTFFDACANVVTEGMASGLPVLTSDRNGSAELLQGTQAGDVLPVVGPRPRIDDCWRQAILVLAADSPRRLAQGTEARRIAESQSISAYSDRFIALLTRLMDQGWRGCAARRTNMLNRDRDREPPHASRLAVL